MKVRFCCAALVCLVSATVSAADNTPPEGFTAVFNGKDFTGFHGVGTEDPRKIQALTDAERAEKFEKSQADLKEHWKRQRRTGQRRQRSLHDHRQGLRRL